MISWGNQGTSEPFTQENYKVKIMKKTRGKFMVEEKKEVVADPLKIDWKAISWKCWEKGIGTALREEVVSKTSNSWDDATVDLIGTILVKFLK